MMRFLFILVLLFTAAESVLGQEMRFKSQDLGEKSKELAGSENFWPLITSVATYDPEANTFTLTQPQQQRFKDFLKQYVEYQKHKKILISEIERGAKVFVADNLQIADSLQKSFDIAIKDGNIDLCFQIMPTFSKLVLEIQRLNLQRRVQNVEARLSEKTGTVSRRQGVVGTWKLSDVGDLYKEQDGIKTEAKSMGKLSFLDGSDIVVNENTVALIKRSKIDRLSNNTDTEVTIDNGSLLARLATESIDRSRFTLNAAAAQTDVRSSKFWASKGTDNTVSLANYQGQATVVANNTKVVLGENEGTIVVEGKEPTPPLKLLPSPKLPWAGPDSVVFEDKALLTWNRIEKSVRYEVDVAPTSTFERDVVTYKSVQNSVAVQNLKKGANFIRIRAYDKQGLRGVDSPIYRLLRNEDLVPPPLFVSNGKEFSFYTTEDSYVLKGITEPGTRLSVNDKPVTVDSKGEFSHTLNLAQEINEVIILAKDASGNTTREKREVVKITEQRLFALTWSTVVRDDKVTKTAKISVSGTAYPVLIAEIKMGEETFSAEIGMGGRWALNLEPKQATSFTLSFKMTDNGRLVAKKTFYLE